MEPIKEENKMLKYHSKICGEVQVQLRVDQYRSGGCIYVGLACMEDGYLEPYGDVTVNLRGEAPDYCGYLDTNHLPDVERFVTENEIGEFTGLVGRSGYCAYPLYLFHVDKLRELCPEGMAAYEAGIGMARKPETKDLSR